MKDVCASRRGNKRRVGFHVLCESHDYVDRLGMSIRALGSTVVETDERNNTKLA